MPYVGHGMRVVEPTRRRILALIVDTLDQFTQETFEIADVSNRFAVVHEEGLAPTPCGTGTQIRRARGKVAMTRNLGLDQSSRSW